MSEAEIMLNSMNTHQVLAIIVDTRVLCCVADSLQERRFPSVGPTDYKDTKASIFRSELIGRIQLVEVRRCKGVDEFENLSFARSVSVADSSTGKSSDIYREACESQIASTIDDHSATKHGNSVPSPSLVSNDALVTGLAFFLQ